MRVPRTADSRASRARTTRRPGRARVSANGVLAFGDTGVTGHPDHRAAMAAAVLAGRQAGLPVLAWTLPAAVAARLSA